MRFGGLSNGRNIEVVMKGGSREKKANIQCSIGRWESGADESVAARLRECGLRACLQALHTVSSVG